MATEKDIKNAKDLQAAWQSGKSIEELNALSMANVGAPLTAESVKLLQKDKNRQVQFVPYEAKNPTLKAISDWWNAKPEPVKPYEVKNKQGEYVPVVNPAADRNTLQRYKAAPTLTWSEAAANMWHNTHPLDFVRDFAKGIYKGGKSIVTDPKGSYLNAAKAAGTFQGILDAAEAERTGKWPEPDPGMLGMGGSIFSLMTPKQLANWRRESMINYRKLATHYSYIDKNGKRQIDNAALMRNVTQRPMEILPLLFGGASKAGQLAQVTKIKPVVTAGKVIEGLAKAGDIVTNPAPYAIAKTVKAASPIVSAGLKKAGVTPTVFTEAGDYSPKMQQAFKDAGVDAALFNSPEMREIVEGVINEKGISPAAIKEAALRSQGVSPSRSMTTGEKPLTPQEKDFRSQANQNLAQNMQDNIEAAYQQATSHRGVFTNTSDFSSGVRKAVDDELAAMGLSIDDVLNNSRFEETRKALQGSKGFPGVFDQFDNLAGINRAAPPPAPKPLTIDFGGIDYTFVPRQQRNNISDVVVDYSQGHWVDATGARVNKPYVTNALDAISDRKNLPPLRAPEAPAQGPNRLTPQSIDSVRRNVNSRFNNAKGDDVAALAAINRGIDNYTIQNAPNFTGDGVAMAQDWTNARKTSQLGQSYGRVPDADPFAPPKPPVTSYDPDQVARTQAARDIVQADPTLKNTTPPTIFERIKSFTPTPGAGQVLGYNVGASTQIPGAGLVGGGMFGAGTKFVRDVLDNASANRIAQSEAAGAPSVPLFQAPDVRVPAGMAGAVATSAQSEYETPVTAEPKPATAAPAQEPLKEYSLEEYQNSLSPSPAAQGTPAQEPLKEYTLEDYQASLQPKPQAHGGRAAYRAGGKVGGIEPLIQALMNKAKMAKKVSNKATEPLLNERDDAIASALAVAQKAI
jgi:hypothetical protein